MNITRELPDQDALRAHLDHLNEDGLTHIVGGIDARNVPFLAVLRGPYADAEDVIYGSPWDGEVEYGTGQLCDECGAANLDTLGSLVYPVTVFLRTDEV